MFNSPQVTQNFKKGVRLATILYQGLAILAFLVIPFMALEFIQTPFLGAYIDNTMIVNDVRPDPPTQAWNLAYQGVEFGTPVTKLDGKPVRSYDDIAAILRTHFPGETIPLTVTGKDGTEKIVEVTLNQFQFDDQVTYIIIPYVVGLVYLLVSLWIFGLRRSESAGMAFTMFATSAAISAAGLFDVYTTHKVLYLWSFAVPLAGGSLFHLSQVFPQESRMTRRTPFLPWASYIVALTLGVYSASQLFNINNPQGIINAWRISYVYMGLNVLVFIGMMVYRRYFVDSPIVKRQAGTILVGTIIGFGPITAWLIGNIIRPLNFNPFWLLPIIFFPITTGYTVMRFRMLRTDYIITRSVLYAILTTLAISGYIALAVGLSLIFEKALPVNSPVLIALTVFGSVLILTPLRIRLQELIDSAFFRGQRVYQQRLQEFETDLASSVDTAGILRVLRANITSSMMPTRIHIFVFDALNDQYAASADDNGRATSDVRFSASSNLPKMLRKDKLPLFIDDANMPEDLQVERTRLALLGANLFVPMQGQERLIGWLGLGDRRSGESYSSQDLDFLDAISTQAAVAIERSQIVNNMERRVQELNALARIAQGINITLNFDDILELIYAQTIQVVPGSDFHLTLFNKTGQYYYYAFCLENDERISQHENIPIPPKTTLEQEVVSSRRPLLTQDYLRECQILNVTPTAEGLYAWIGVPLNTGAETIGALSVASHDPSILYTPGQLDLLQAIADQAAGAIVKSRLLQETERRAQQLSILNVITRQLTSTLDPEPLLRNILESAVSILDCEAGSLFLVDEQTDELVFRVTVSPVVTNLVGQRLPPGSGVVGKAVNTRSPVIVNEVQTSAQWNANLDKQTGFSTRGLLAVPMEIQERVIGVIEIINKKDGLPFTAEDQNLLSAFASQAAVAIENARLYTLTDQALAARVEELSVMQRIDRELNASLEVDRAMRITLEWAMRQSGAEAGLIGVIYEKGLGLVAQQGYGDILDKYKEEPIPSTHPLLIDAVATGKAQRIALSGNEEGHSFLPGTHNQLVVPIRRETSVIGLFLLESTSPDAIQPNAQEFLSRLSDHAAIALSNAQLYSQVQNANNAKSKFVSFVAHELKNPMASIKGYTELVLKGMAGPVNEMQSKFLSTVRSNVDRMNTIVSDLSDLSKIEAGKLKLEFKSVDVLEVTEDVIRSTKHQIDEKQQVIELQIEEALPQVWADRNRMIQIMVNLVSNAHKYTPAEGKIIIGARKTHNEWDPNGPQQVVHIWVKDNGIGIGPEDKKNIFTQYFRTEYSKDMASGTGLGLNITKSLVEMQGGTIWFESELRKGTAFQFTVPISEN